ncbi:MAG: PhzF family phenazine biosynthesis protein, partial [Aggregatilineales bacterium]
KDKRPVTYCHFVPDSRIWHDKLDIAPVLCKCGAMAYIVDDATHHHGVKYRMLEFPFMQVDAFTTQALAGNPCAIVFAADTLTDAQMQQIALEMNLSETAFVLKSDKADFRARYFTPAAEIPLAGHPTIATIHALLERDDIQFSGSQHTIQLELQAGVIPVDIVREDDRVHITMTQNRPQFLNTYDPAEIMPAMGLTPDDVLAGYPIQTVSTGTPHLMIPLNSLDTLKRVAINAALYRPLREKHDFFGGPHLFCLEGITPEGTTFARHPNIPPGVHEDPFTGSSTGSMASYLWHYGLLEDPVFIAEQGHWMNRPGIAQVEIIGARDNIEAVRVGGEAVTIVRGTLYL